jgi:DNA-binding NarL/FixJ family response regulator
MEWWYNNSGLNLLKGVDGDTSNPIRLPDATIIQFLRTIPAARSSFNRIVPNMLEDEQIRLRAIAEGSAKYVLPDYEAVEDTFQNRQNTAGVRTAGRFGGTRRGGNN